MRYDTSGKVLAAGLACLLMSGVAAVAADKKFVDPVKLGTSGFVQEMLAEKGAARVIVRVRTVRATAALQAAVAAAPTRAAAKAEIAAAIDGVVAKHFAASKAVKSILKLKTVPAFSVEVDEAQLAALLADPNVVSVGIDHRLAPQLDTTTVTVGMPGAWSMGATGYGRTAVVIDTGVQRDHPFLGTARVVEEACFTTDATCPNATNSQIGPGASYPGNHGIAHGTHVSGITLGKNTVTGGTPAAGVAKAANLIAVNAFNADHYTYDSALIAAMEFVEDEDIAHPGRNITAMNMSIGGGDFLGYCDGENTSFVTVVDRLRARNISLVVSAGNDYYSNAMSWPGCLSNVVSVAATNRLGDAISYYSNLTTRTYLAAPGGDSTNGGSVVSSVLGGLYDAYQGTSMAAPHVTGALTALAKLYPTTKLSYLEDSLRRSGTAVTDTRYGTGPTLARLRVNHARQFLGAPTAPTNDDFASAKVLARISDEAWGSTSGATRETGEPNPSTGVGPSIWWKWVPTSTGRVTLSTYGSNFDTVLGVYVGSSVSTLTKLITNDNANADTKTSAVTFNANAGSTYRIVVAGKAAGDGGTVRLNGLAYPTNDAFAKARAVTISGSEMTLLTGNNYLATIETNEPTFHGVYSVWWKFVAPVTGTYTVETSGSTTMTGAGADTQLAVYTGLAVGSLTVISSNDDGGPGSTSLLSLPATAGTTYYVAVGSYPYTSVAPEANSGPIRLIVTPPGFVYEKVQRVVAD